MPVPFTRAEWPGYEMAEVAEERPVLELGAGLDLPLDNIRRAQRASEALLSRLEPLVADVSTDDVAFVVFGSGARYEVTGKSDIDWTLLVDGFSDPAHYESVLEVEQRLERTGLKGPGETGTFGGLAFSHDVVHMIGGSDDTNRNTTQRALLLLESRPVGNGLAHTRVIRNVLTRYIQEDWGWQHKRGPAAVPRFLQNDLARYWRTVAVDFAYKRRTRGGKGWALRTVKLRLSRKVTYAAGLLGCFSCDLEGIGSTGKGTPEDSTPHVVNHLHRRFSYSPLDVIALAVAPFPELHKGAGMLLDAYDAFLGLLNDEEKRSALENLAPEDSSDDPVHQEARSIGRRFQDGLNEIFFDQPTRISELTRIYGVF